MNNSLVIWHEIQLDDERIMVCVYTTNGLWEVRTHSLEGGRELSRAALKGQPSGMTEVMLVDKWCVAITYSVLW